MAFYIVVWKEFIESKMIERAELIKELDKVTALNKMREFNAQKRLTSTDYSAYDLTSLFDKKGLKIVEAVVEEIETPEKS